MPQSLGGTYFGPQLSNANHSFFDKMKDGSIAVEEEIKMDANANKSKNRFNQSSSHMS